MVNKSLIKRCQSGDKEAFNDLVRFYYPFTLKFLWKLTGKQELSEDLTQETFIKVIKNIECFKLSGKASFSTYLLTIAKNTYFDYLRKNNKENSMVNIDDILEQRGLRDEYFQENDYEVLLTKIEELPQEQREAIKLKYLEGYTLEEIANKEKVASKTIKSRLFEGRKKLKAILKGLGIYE